MVSESGRMAKMPIRYFFRDDRMQGVFLNAAAASFRWAGFSIFAQPPPDSPGIHSHISLLFLELCSIIAY